MANRIEIIIDGKVQDYTSTSNFPLSLDYVVQSSDNYLETRGSATRYKFRLPATKHNTLTAESFDHIEVDNPTMTGGKEAVIKIGGVDIFRGRAYLEKTTLQGAKYNRDGCLLHYNFYGGNSTWGLHLDRIRLCDLPFEDHVFDSPTISNGYNANPNTQSFAYTLIKWQEWSNPSDVQHVESTLLLFVRPLLDKIFNSLGYTINSNFLSSDEFKRYVMPIGWGDYLAAIRNKLTYFRGEQTIPISSNNGANPIGLIPYDTELSDDPDNFTSPYYTAYAAGQYKAFVKVVVIHNDASQGASIQFVPSPDNELHIVDDIGNIVAIGALQASTENIFVTTNQRRNEYIFSFNSFTLALGQKIAIDCNFILWNQDEDSVPYDLEASEIEIRYCQKTPTLGIPITSKVIPHKWTARDLLIDIARIFNLVFATDEGGKSVTIEPADQYRYTDRLLGIDEVRQGFYRSTSDASSITSDQWSKKRNFIKEACINTNKKLSSAYIHGYAKDDNDGTVQDISDGLDLALYDARYSLPYASATAKEQDDRLKFFAATYHIIDREIMDANTPTNIDAQIPCIYAESYFDNPSPTETEYKYKPRLLWFNGQNQYSSIVTIEGVATPQPLAFAVNYQDDSGLHPSLAFDDQTIKAGVQKFGLLRRFHLSDRARMANNKILTEWVFLDLRDIRFDTFRNMKRIDHLDYLLIEIKAYKPSSHRDHTQVILIPNRYPEQKDIDAITAAGLAGYTAGNP